VVHDSAAGIGNMGRSLDVIAVLHVHLLVTCHRDLYGMNGTVGVNLLRSKLVVCVCAVAGVEQLQATLNNGKGSVGSVVTPVIPLPPP
jgi:hypothetical protein